MNDIKLTSILPTLMIGVAAGSRSMTGIAAVARARAMASDRDAPNDGAQPVGPRIVRRFGRTVDHKIANASIALAVLELMTDKTADVPDHLGAGSIMGRVLAGAIVGGAVAQMVGDDRRLHAIAGAVAAFAGVQLSHYARCAAEDELPRFVASLLEDVSAVALAGTGARLLAR